MPPRRGRPPRVSARAASAILRPMSDAYYDAHDLGRFGEIAADADLARSSSPGTTPCSPRARSRRARSRSSRSPSRTRCSARTASTRTPGRAGEGLGPRPDDGSSPRRRGDQGRRCAGPRRPDAQPRAQGLDVDDASARHPPGARQRAGLCARAAALARSPGARPRVPSARAGSAPHAACDTLPDQRRQALQPDLPPLPRGRRPDRPGRADDRETMAELCSRRWPRPTSPTSTSPAARPSSTSTSSGW